MNYPKDATEATSQIVALIAEAQKRNKELSGSGYTPLSDAMLLADNFGLPLVVPTELASLQQEIRDEWESSNEWNSSGC